ncbi:hypothetical protein Tco_0906753 [Tanacetum coccineum]|uniref:Retrovirus-related Pol polyprotein from transposon TNT 1-94-like beta-barrel domain-containing protein n=1 Tax=Tanacetum coccineum TaxID=301880 RepID=A0ABQ5CJP6_9ASTR
MFEEPLSTDPIWSELGQQRIISWRYYDACRVHCLNLESMDIYMLIERTYPLSAEMCKAMLDKKLQGGKPDENCYKMLKMMEKQAVLLGGKRETAVKPSAGCNWRPQRHHNWYNDYPHRALQNKGIVDSGCSRHMTGNKAYLAEYQDFNGGPIAFGGSKGYITGKDEIKLQDEAGKERQLTVIDLDYLTDSMNYQPVRSENQANKHAGPQEANQNAGTEDIIDTRDSEKEDESAQDYFVLPIWSSYSSTVKRSIAKDAGDAPNKDPDLKTNGKPVNKEDQVFLDELERLNRQEKDANDASEALRKEFAQQTEDLLLQAGAAKPSSTNIVNIASTPVSTASPDSDLTNPDQDDSEIPALEDIYQHLTDGIFTNSSYDDEGVVADFTNLETVMNVGPIPTSRMNSIDPLTLILGDPQSAVQTRNKITKSSGAYAFVTPKTSHLSAVKRIFRYLKGKPKLGLWYPRVSSFDLEAYSDSDYAGANLDRKSTTGGCQFLGRRLISWQCKKQTIVATSTTARPE